MIVRDHVGISLAECSVDEALHRAWAGVADLDVVRVPDPPRSSWPMLRAEGFICKPATVTWYSDVRPDRGAFLSQLSKNDRQNLRTAERHARDAGLQLDVVSTGTGRFVDEFLELYVARIDEMPHGINVAAGERAAMLTDSDYLAVAARDAAGRLVGATVCQRADVDQILRIRFSAVTPEWRAASLTRVMYAHTADVARDLGLTHLTLGTDPNLYGHIPQSGLLSFKARLGFHPRVAPAPSAEPPPDEADLVLRLDRLSDPSLIVGYAPGGESLLRVEIVTADPEVDVRPYARGLTQPPVVSTTRSVPCCG